MPLIAYKQTVMGSPLANDATYDVVIVGGGTAGLALAARLSEEPSVTVAVLEAGSDPADPRLATPAMWPLLLKSELDWDFRTTPQAALGGRKLDCPAGRVLGGTSAINSFLFCPSSRSHMDAWGRLLGGAKTSSPSPSWGWDAYIKATRKAVTLNDGQQGSGPVKLKTSNVDEPHNAWVKVWNDTFTTLGFPPADPFSGDTLGATNTPETIDPSTGQRSSSATAYLDTTVRQRPNLCVVTGAAVSKVVLDSTDPANIKATGVEYTIKQDDGSVKTLTVNARKEVVVAAGALNSPRILELSGVGGAEVLRAAGIDRVVVDNPHVGENLQNHVLTGTAFELRDDSDMPSRDPLLRQEPEALQAAMAAYGQGGKGPFSTSGNVAYGQIPFLGLQADEQDVDKLVEKSLSSSPSAPTPEATAFAAKHQEFARSVLVSSKDVPVLFMSTNTFLPLDGAEPTYRPPGRHYTIAFLLAHPLSRGSVHITPGNAGDTQSAAGVAIDAGFLTHPLDVEVMARSLQFVESSLAHTEPLASHLRPESLQKKRFADLEQTKEYVKRNVAGGNHWVGSCAMMARELGGVVDDELCVYDVRNLRVCDASVVPIVPRGNTQAVVYAIAEAGAEMIKRSLRGE